LFDLSKYWTWDELCDRWGIRKFEVFDFLKKGLQIYYDMGDTAHCPGEFHRYKILEEKQHYILTPADIAKYLPDDSEPKDNVLPEYTEQTIKDEERAKSKALKTIPEKLKREFLKIENEMSAIHEDDPEHELWKYFEMPEIYGYRRDLLLEYRDCLFNFEEVVEFEEKNNMKPTQAKEFVKKHIKTDSDENKMSHKAMVAKNLIEIADEIWKKEKITITAMCRRPEIKEVAKHKNGKPYTERAIREHVKKVAPSNKPGRPPKNKV